MDTPLAERLRPHNLASFVGQSKIAGSEGLITRLLAGAKVGRMFPSLVFWGPPGCGKTSLARLIAQDLGRDFYEFSAVNTSVKDVEKSIPKKTSQLSLGTDQAPVVFIDEIHRFSKSQQDTLLPHVERGHIILLGATTENPSFSVIGALLSRCRVIVLERLSELELDHILTTALVELGTTMKPEARQFLLRVSNGDARVILNVLEIADAISEGRALTKQDIENSLQRRQLSFDHGGEEFYTTISALHKSVRGSDPDASLYWLARMLEAGQDPLYIARRLIRMASEDIGLADPQALLIANTAYDTCSRLGVPECTLSLAEATVYLARSPKSNVLYLAYQAATSDVSEFGNLPVPLHIRNAPTSLMKDLEYGKGYDYSHSPEGIKKEGIEYFPPELHGRKYLP